MGSSFDLDKALTWGFQFEEGSFLRGAHIENPGQRAIHFLHGNGLCGKTYWSLLSGLLKDYSLFLHDCVGHGDSDEGSGFVSWEQSAEHAYQVIRSQQQQGKLPEQLLGLGHSFGGVLTIKLAAKYPDLFHSLVLMDPIIMPEAFIDMPSDMPNPLAEKTRKRRNHWSTPQEAFNYFRSKMAYKDWSDDSLDNFVRYALYWNEGGGLSLKCPPAVEADIFSSTPDGLWNSIRALKTPTVILYGDSSYPFMEAACQQASENAAVSLEKVQGSHCFMLESPQTVSEKILLHYEKMASR